MTIRAVDLIKRLVVVDENILAEAVNQVSLFVDIARYRVAKMRLRTQATAALEGFRVERDRKIRAMGSADGEKLTEAGIKAKIARSPECKRLQAAFDGAEATEEFARLLLEAGRMRKEAIKIIAEAQYAEGAREMASVERAEAFRKLSNKARDLVRKQRASGAE